jgi:hypothetical protein
MGLVSGLIVSQIERENKRSPRGLGTWDFVEKVPSESEEPLGCRFRPLERGKRIETKLREECQKGKTELEELRMGSRRGEIPWVRSEITERLMKELGMSLAVSTSAISKIL